MIQRSRICTALALLTGLCAASIQPAHAHRSDSSNVGDILVHAYTTKSGHYVKQHYRRRPHAPVGNVHLWPGPMGGGSDNSVKPRRGNGNPANSWVDGHSKADGTYVPGHFRKSPTFGGSGDTWVNGHYKKDGTFVPGHLRKHRMP